MKIEEKTIQEKYKYLWNNVYENVTHLKTGRLAISTYYAKKTANLLGGDYLDLNKKQKEFFRCDIVSELINIERGFDYYLLF